MNDSAQILLSALQEIQVRCEGQLADQIATEALYRYKPEPQMMRCPSCHGAGNWETECCSGASGCSCRGQVIDMGTCNVCGGSGEVPENIDRERLRANIQTIEGLCYIGSGPRP